MLNYLWAGMIMAGVIYAAFTGKMPELTNAALDSAKEAVVLCITMIGVMAFWSGLMEIGREAGLIRRLERGMTPVIRFLFPDLPEGHPAAGHITANMIANILGLGWAATPEGLRAMEELGKLEEERRQRGDSRVPAGTAGNEMCTFLILNISSLQLIPVNVIAYRSQYGSVEPAAIVGAGILATFMSTTAAILFCRVMNQRKRKISPSPSGSQR